MKFRIPSLLKSDKTKATLKQFLLSLLATTFSIALTFGTAAVIDHHKKQEAKREIVMMVMYDMYNSLEAIEEVDSTIRQSMHLQRQLLEDTTKFSELWYSIAGTLPQVSYTETTERIFSSSIETINTVGDVSSPSMWLISIGFAFNSKQWCAIHSSTVSPEVLFLNGARISSILTT